ncbi:IS5 family transposase [Acinetobacter lwoffii]|uniref:IS5 family transposase n=2 Tax=Acinetobacter TaxID=469 RepID=A0AAW8AX05_ACILW|nr:IS5 family transposase [Acinetobacter lwoffii]MDP1370793.1 IS5 family transposase [Acinetobacter lwoffii]MDP1390187.1 IS5 family transposase [Acinetobacter lwoffii]MDP1447831.1 IS5 family transposase [Acinetobacter lwoffii]
MKYIDSKKLSETQFKRYTGISWSTFELMVEQLQKHVPDKGRPSKLSIEDQILLCLSYWREYRTLFHVATSYGVSEPTASRIFRHVEDNLIKSNLFNLPKNLPEGEGIDWNVVIVDATEIPIQRPKKQKKSYSGKKKTHTFKVQAIIHYQTQKILSLCTSHGAVHDFELFKRTLNQIPAGAFILADKGYQGIYTVYPNSLLPLKAKKRCKLDPELKIFNQEINKRRIGIEHVFGSLKTFKILAERYRNRGNRLGLRFNLIAGIYNLELSKKWLMKEAY